jgi:hypothetical protein
MRGVALVLLLVAGGSGGFVSAAAGVLAAFRLAIDPIGPAVLVVIGIVVMVVAVATLREWLRDPRVVRSGLLGGLAARLEGVRRDGDDLVMALTEPDCWRAFLSFGKPKGLRRRIENWHERATDVVPPKHRPAWERIWSDTFGGVPLSQSREDLAAHERAGHEWRVRRALDLLRTILNETPQVDRQP